MTSTTGYLPTCSKNMGSIIKPQRSTLILASGIENFITPQLHNKTTVYSVHPACKKVWLNISYFVNFVEIICTHMHKDTMECIVTSVHVYTANDRYLAVVHSYKQWSVL